VYLRCQVLMAAMKMTAFWIVLCILVKVNQYFRGAYCPHHQGDLMMEEVHTSETLVYFNKTIQCYMPEGYHQPT
jgi:hypothetical protein